MTRQQMVSRLQALGFENPTAKYEEVKDFLHYNRTPIKAVTAVEQSPNEGRVHLHLTDSNGDDWGTVEW